MFLVQGAEKTYADFELTVPYRRSQLQGLRTDNAYIYELADAP